MVIRGAEGERVVSMEDFHVGPFTTAVGDGELLTEVRLRVRAGAGSAHEKVERRAGDWAIAAASAAVWIDGGTIADAGVALSAVGPMTIHLSRGEERCAARRRRRSCSPRWRPWPPRTACPRRTGAARWTTSATWPVY